MRTVYLDGQFVPESEAKLSIYDLSVMQGAAAFEMTRSFNGQHFKLREHLDRLATSCQMLTMNIPQEMGRGDHPGGLESLCRRVSELNDHGPGEEHRLLIVVSPGCAPMYRELGGVIDHPFVYIADFPLRFTVAGFGKYFTEGVHAVTSAIQQVPDACIPSSAKHRSRLHFHLAQQQAPAGTWPLLTTGYCNELNGAAFTEAPGANIVYVARGTVYTVDEECLHGISMQTVRDLTLAKHSEEFRDVDIGKISELWLTGTPFCMIPVVSLDGKPIGDGTPGPVYKATLAKWSAMVGVDIQEQITAWDSRASIRSTSN